MSSTSVRLSGNEFEKLSGFIYRACGISLSQSKKILVESRLQKRLSVLRLPSFSAYYDLLSTPLGAKEELVHMIDCIATNKTDFFREPVHFQFMKEEVLPAFAEEGQSRIFKVWSSACSTGEEPFTIAMVLEEFGLLHRIPYTICATDISTKVLARAAEAIYPQRTVADVPESLKKKYLLRSKDTMNPTVRVVPKLRGKVMYKRLNLMDDSYDVDRDFDIVFCRNVLIYFDRVTQEKVVNKLLSHVRPGGYLFIGHSESIYQMKLPVRQLRPTIFQKVL
jgi:chemotaxis protein methyltransferase CheR